MQRFEIHDSLAIAYPYRVKIPGVASSSGAVHFWDNKELFPNGILRCFWITGVGENQSRGNHAHLKESQVLVAVTGTALLEVLSLDGRIHSFEMDDPSEGVFVPPFNWTQVTFTEHSVLLGLADREFSEEDYIRDKSDFEQLQASLPRV